MKRKNRYDAAFFAEQAEHSAAGANVIVPTVVELLRPRSVVDIGCGVGAWLAAFAASGVNDLIGVDGAYVDRTRLLIPSDVFRAADLAEPLDLGRKFDLVVSLEVAEHLSAERVSTFVDNLSRHGDLLLFSAAVPRQAGTHHVNLQWPSYWAKRFGERGYQPFDVIRPRFWDDPRIPAWFRQNILIFARGTALERARAVRPVPGMLDVAHPELYEPEPPLRYLLAKLWPAARAAVSKRLPKERFSKRSHARR